MNESQTILLIDDDIDLCESVKGLLTQNGFLALIEHNSQNIETILKENKIDLILLDIILPGDKDGITICKIIRQLTTAPIIMLTGVETDMEKVLSLEGGADNYITKPFNSRVLIAHIQSSLRRRVSKKGQKFGPDDSMTELVDMQYHVYEFIGWRLNITARVLLSPQNETIKLTSAEFILLQALVTHPQCVLSRDQLLDLINSNSVAFDRSIDILISRIRSKLESHSLNSKLIDTVRNAGYLLACTVSKQIMDSQTWHELLSKEELQIEKKSI